jgi:hypothetical protein
MKIISIALTFASIGACWAQFGIQVRSMGPLPGGPFNDKVVTGKPFAADAIQQTNQTLVDGTHITHQQTIAVARDSQGRTRREETIPSPSGEGQTVKTIFISDPVAQVNYVLGPDNIAHKFPFSKSGLQAGGMTMSAGHSEATQGTVRVQQFTAAGGAVGAGLSVMSIKEGDASTDSLGTQTIGGVEANGTRTTITIPAGQIGNDAPIVLTDEHWYSQDLQTMVTSKQTDPRFGESSFQLTNIQRTEPPASMFQVPANYAIEEP